MQANKIHRSPHRSCSVANGEQLIRTVIQYIVTNFSAYQQLVYQKNHREPLEGPERLEQVHPK